MIRISIDRDRIDANRIDGLNRPVVAIEYEGNPQCIWAYKVRILGTSTVVYDPRYKDGDALGAAWVETDADVETE